MKPSNDDNMNEIHGDFCAFRDMLTCIFLFVTQSVRIAEYRIRFGDELRSETTLLIRSTHRRSLYVITLNHRFVGDFF